MIRYLIVCTLTATSLMAAKTPTIVVHGEASIYKPSDRAVLTLGSVTEEKLASAAIDLNAKRMESVYQAISPFKIDPQHIQTTTFTVEPLYTPRPPHAAEDWSPSIYAYRVRHLIAIRVEKLTTLGALIDAASQAGASSFESLHFTLNDPRTAKNEAIAEATRNALQAAETIAKTAEIKLGAIRSVTLGSSPEPVPYRASFAVSKSSATSIAPGDVEISATITVEYEICGYCQ